MAQMPKKKEPDLDPKEQFKRFVETAHEPSNFQESLGGAPQHNCAP
jgi:hypothetical protein